eukprot:SAG31_NODE_31033_length_373_cov_0.755474_1_plen_35_part_10
MGYGDDVFVAPPAKDVKVASKPRRCLPCLCAFAML